MKQSLVPEKVEPIMARLTHENREFSDFYPGEPVGRQPIHTVYGGAHLFKSNSGRKLGDVALKVMQDYASDATQFAKALRLSGHDVLDQSQASSNNARQFVTRIYDSVMTKLQREPIEDFRLDFEDGYGNRPNKEEDDHSVSSASEVAKGMSENSLPPFIGIRVKPLTEELKSRSIRTLDIFVTTLLEKSGGDLPGNFIITLPKVQIPGQVSAFVDVLEQMEDKTGLPSGSLKIELMIETPQSILNQNGQSTLPALVRASQGRCISAHFGVYDYTASTNITAALQSMGHPACDFARHMMIVALSGTGITLSDGATNILPVAPHTQTPLSDTQVKENRRSVHAAWRLAYNDILHSLRHGYYQGWDLHPAQLPVRYAAVYSFFQEGLAAASIRLKTFIEKAAQASLIGDVFDDAATGQGLLNYFLRGINCGAITEDEATATGLSLEEIRSRSFLKILESRVK